MENFRGVIRRRLTFGIGLNLLGVVFVVIGVFSNMAAKGSSDSSDSIRGFQVGMTIGLQLVSLFYINKYRKALKAQDKLKNLYIEENDERTKLINDKIGGIGFNVILGVIAIATVISSLYNIIVFITLLGVLMFMLLTRGLLKIYYRNKF